METRDTTVKKVKPATIVKNTDTILSFKVDNVDVCAHAPPLKSAEEIVRKNLGIKSKFEDFSHRSQVGPSYVNGMLPGFILAIHTAFQSHYPLKLSVSDFVILIGQGLGRHIGKYAEELRQFFVNHEGQQEILIERNEFVMGKQNDWSTVFGEFGEQIKSRVKTDIYDVVVDNTSVATSTSRIVSEIALMDCMKNYFNYTVSTKCGIPEIILEGTTEDWKKLREKVGKLVEMNKDDCLKLGWWLKHLVPVIEEICDTGINRKANLNFWTSIYKYDGPKGSGTPHITGWCTVFFPYLAQDIVNEFSSPPMLYVSQIPKQVCEVPFVWKYIMKSIPMTFYGGFLAQFNRKDNSVSPSYFWSVAYDADKTEKKIAAKK